MEFVYYISSDPAAKGGHIGLAVAGTMCADKRFS